MRMAEQAVTAELAGKVAIVTGGGSGIGRAAVELLAARGATVAYCDRAAESLAEVAEGLDPSYPSHGQVVDVTDDQATDEFVADTVARFGRLDIVVTAAGIQRYGIAAVTSSADWDEVFDVNVKGCLNAVRPSLAHLRETSGSVVLVSSVQAMVAQNNAAAYVSSKAALAGLARSIAVDEAGNGVRANVVCPGSVDTPMLRASASLFSDGSTDGVEAVLQSWGNLHPLGRVARTSEVAEAIAFLASDRASFITGVSLPVDGGLLASVSVAVSAS